MIRVIALAWQTRPGDETIKIVPLNVLSPSDSQTLWFHIDKNHPVSTMVTGLPECSTLRLSQKSARNIGKSAQTTTIRINIPLIISGNFTERI